MTEDRTDQQRETMLKLMGRLNRDTCGQCGKEIGNVIYADAICPGGRFCSRECLDDRLAGK